MQSDGSKKLLVNEAITSATVRLIDGSGRQVGVVSRQEALDAAQGAGLDLVLIAESSDPPVAKVMDYGRHIFNKKKSKLAAKRKQKQVHVKEIKIRPSTDVGDYNIKLRNLIRFLGAGDKVKITLRYRGREMAHQELGMEMMQRVQKDLSLFGAMELSPKMEGRQLSMVFAPHKKGSAEAALQVRMLSEADQEAVEEKAEAVEEKTEEVEEKIEVLK